MIILHIRDNITGRMFLVAYCEGSKEAVLIIDNGFSQEIRVSSVRKRIRGWMKEVKSDTGN